MSDTIAAIATAGGNGGIGIIRMSGEDSFSILNKIFVPKKKKEKIVGYTIQYGHIMEPKNQEKIDEVLISYFVKPHSYTTEDLCEIQSHGGSIVMRRILEICLENGAQMAEPGEFTKRAFLSGRIDLSQAESIIDLIQSKTEKESQTSMKQLQGDLSRKIQEIRKEILEVMVDIEASIDYPEYDIEEVQEKRVGEVLQKTKQKIEELEINFYRGKIIKEGIKVAIVGRPNVGKSSLLNALLNEDRAIVTSQEGTTRDTIEEFMDLRGIPVKIIDTAGIRNARDEVEQIGIQRSKEMIEKADLIIAIFDGSTKLQEEDREIIELIQEKKAIIVCNKIDIAEYKEEIQDNLKGKEMIEISALKREGIDQIGEKIAKIFQVDNISSSQEEVIITNVRHKNLIKIAKKNTEEAVESLSLGMPMDIIAIPMKNILESLGEITGEDVSENIIKEIFSKFCLGK